MKTLTATEALDRYFLESRAKVLDLAAILDRIHRGGPRLNDPRLERLHQAIELLLDHSEAKAERVQQVFSLGYEANWDRPKPRS
jgi:hypothetical protein